MRVNKFIASKDLKAVRKRRIARRKACDSFKIQTNPNPYLRPNRNYIENYVLGAWNE